MDDLGGMTEEEQIEMAIRMSMQQDAAPQEEPMATEGKQNDFFSIFTALNHGVADKIDQRLLKLLYLSLSDYVLHRER